MVSQDAWNGIEEFGRNAFSEGLGSRKVFRCLANVGECAYKGMRLRMRRAVCDVRRNEMIIWIYQRQPKDFFLKNKQVAAMQK